MIMTLFKKECAQILKSLIFWLYVACLVLFFNSQMPMPIITITM